MNILKRAAVLAAVPVLGAGLALATAAAPASAAPAASPVITNSSWNGYIKPGPVDAVGAWWAVPSLSLLSLPTSTVGEWVGLGGLTTATSAGTALVQIGISQPYLTPGQTWEPFYEIIYGNQQVGPKYGTQKVAAKDVIEAYVEFYGGGHYVISVMDTTQHWTWAFNVYNAGNTTPTTGEWIVESPNGLSMADFGTFTFTNMLYGVATGLGLDTGLNDGSVVRVVDTRAQTYVPSPIEDETGTITWRAPQ